MYLWNHEQTEGVRGSTRTPVQALCRLQHGNFVDGNCVAQLSGVKSAAISKYTTDRSAVGWQAAENMTQSTDLYSCRYTFNHLVYWT